MQSISELMRNSRIGEEYERAYYLNSFEKLCKKMHRQPSYKLSVLSLFRQSFNVVETTKALWQREFGITLSDKHAELLYSWLWAHFKKKPHRRQIPLATKRELYALQHGHCNLCNKPLGDEWTLIHVDHYIPWSLVGDELTDNLQLLCSACNEKKHTDTKYVFENMIGLSRGEI